MTEHVQEIKYHPGFVGGMELLLWTYRNYFYFEEEHYLSREPLRIDLLIIKKTTDVNPDLDIARIFRKYNCIEYKNPTDELSIDDFYKVIAYSCLYKSLGKTVDEIPAGEVTASIFRHTCPRKLFSDLEIMGFDVEKKYPGVYYVNGNTPFPTQIVVTGQLMDKDYAALRILTPTATEDDIREFILQTMLNEDSGFRRNADAVLQVSVAANKETYEKIRRNPNMCQALRDLFKEEIDAEIAAAVKKAVEDTKAANDAAVRKAVEDAKAANDAANNNRNRKIAEDMLMAHSPIPLIAHISTLTESKVREIAKSINVAVVN